VELAGERKRFGYQRLHLLLRREGLQVNHKRVLRLYREEGLALRRRKRRRLPARLRQVLPQPTADSSVPTLVDGLRFRHTRRWADVSHAHDG
jgi:putative transposase